MDIDEINPNCSPDPCDWHIPFARHHRAMMLTAGIMKPLHGVLPRDLWAPVARKVYEVLAIGGYEVVTDAERAEAGLPPRDARGWTATELAVLEQHRLDTMLAPMVIQPGDNVSLELLRRLPPGPVVAQSTAPAGTPPPKPPR